MPVIRINDNLSYLHDSRDVQISIDMWFFFFFRTEEPHSEVQINFFFALLQPPTCESLRGWFLSNFSNSPIPVTQNKFSVSVFSGKKVNLEKKIRSL